jgi:hypothetical protein
MIIMNCKNVRECLTFVHIIIIIKRLFTSGYVTLETHHTADNFRVQYGTVQCSVLECLRHRVGCYVHDTPTRTIAAPAHPDVFSRIA